MPSRGQAVTLSYYAYDTVASAPKPGDVANHAIRLSKDGGTPAAPTNAPAETDATNLPGWYKVTLTTAEATADVVVLGGKSSTAGIVISGTQVTFEQLPTAAAGAAGGLLNDKAGYALSATGLDVAKGWGTWSARQTVQAIAQFLFGKRSGVPAAGAGGSPAYVDNAAVSYGSVTVDTAGNITASGLTPPA